MTAEAIMAGLKAAGWSVAEWSTDRGHVAHVERSGHKVTVTAPRLALAWLVLWLKLSGGRVGSSPTAGRVREAQPDD